MFADSKRVQLGQKGSNWAVHSHNLLQRTSSVTGVRVSSTPHLPPAPQVSRAGPCRAVLVQAGAQDGGERRRGRARLDGGCPAAPLGVLHRLRDQGAAPAGRVHHKQVPGSPGPVRGDPGPALPAPASALAELS